MCFFSLRFISALHSFQIKDTVAFMIIMAVIMIWYSVSYYALLYPNSEFTWKQMEHILSNGYWVLFGELNLDGDTCKKYIYVIYLLII